MTDTATVFEDDCRQEDGPGTQITVVGIDAAGVMSLWCLGCAEDKISNAELYQEDYTDLVGTHILGEETLAQIFGPNWRDDNADLAREDLDEDCRTDCFPKHPDAVIIAVYLDRSTGALGTICTNPACFKDIYDREDRYAIFGTHTLPIELIDELFPEVDDQG